MQMVNFPLKESQLAWTVSNYDKEKYFNICGTCSFIAGMLKENNQLKNELENKYARTVTFLMLDNANIE